MLVYFLVCYYAKDECNSYSSDTCDRSWRRNTRQLIISSHALSDLTFLIILSALVMYILCIGRKGIHNGKKQQNARPQHECVEEHSERVNQFAGRRHRCADVATELSLKDSLDEHVYSKPEHRTAKAVKNTKDQNYNQLDRQTNKTGTKQNTYNSLQHL